MVNETEIRRDICGAALFRSTGMTPRDSRTRCASKPRASQRRNAGTTRNGIIPSTTLTSENAINGP
jgi:hypothetical protein